MQTANKQTSWLLACFRKCLVQISGAILRGFCGFSQYIQFTCWNIALKQATAASFTILNSLIVLCQVLTVSLINT